MKIDGKEIASKKLAALEQTVQTIREQKIVPCLGVILVGDDPASLSYIRQKKRAADAIGARVLVEQLPAHCSAQTVQQAIHTLNDDPSVHGLIVQRPVSKEQGDIDKILNTICPAKDIDGFVPHSPHEVPVAKAVLVILQAIHEHVTRANLLSRDFTSWLNEQTIAVIGRGQTAGRPIAAMLTKLNCATSIIHSQTENPRRTLKQSSVIISCVGKQQVIKKSWIDRGVIFISVGMWRDTRGLLHGDYEEDDIKDIASFYTPTPGGVGPVNVACLMENLVTAVNLAE